MKTFCLIRVNDNTIPCAIKWLAKKGLTEKITVVTNDKKVPFYAGMETEKKPNWNIQVYNNKDLKSIETFAMDQKAGIIILKRRLKKNKEMPGFEFFKEINTFTNRRDITAIYFRNP